MTSTYLSATIMQRSRDAESADVAFIGRNRDNESILCHISKENWIFVEILICDSYIVISKAVNYISAPLHPPGLTQEEP